MRRRRSNIRRKQDEFDFLDLLDDEEIYESEEYIEDEYAEEYADDMYESEEYIEEEYAEEYADDMYESEEYIEDEYAEEYADDMYESEEYIEEEYAEEYADDMYESEEYIEEEYAEEYADDMYESEEYIEEEYAEEYADDMYESEEYIEEEYAEEYADDMYESEEYMEDEYAEEDAIYPYDNRGKRRRTGRSGNQENEIVAFFVMLITKLHNLPVMDKILLGTGAIVLAIAVVTCSIYMNMSGIDAQVAAFADAGEQLENLGIVGESGLLAVTNAEIAMLEAVEEAPEEVEEEEVKEEFSIGINMTSVEKDLKIKFVNTRTGKLIKDIPFAVKVTDASKDSEVWTDDDKDGIIYRKDMTPGRYEVLMQKIDELKDYTFSNKALCVTVKDKIEYKQIDVKDEIKSESEVDAAAEDTAEDVVTEEVLEDTVEWVASTRTEIGSGEVTYEEVKKKNIPDPTETASLVMTATSLLSAASVEEAVITGVSISGASGIAVGESITLTAEVTGTGEYSKKVTWSSSDTSVATVKGGTVTGISAGTVTITAKTEDESVFSSVDISVTEKSGVITGVSISGAKELTIGESVTLTAKVEGEGEYSKQVTWTSSDAAVATVSEGVVTAVGAGSTTIMAKTANENVFASVDITVKEKPASVNKVTISGASTVQVGATITLSAQVEGVNNPSTEVEWSSANSNIASITDDGKVTGINTGKVKITATSKADSTKSDTIEITVTETAQEITIAIPETLTVYIDKTEELKATITGSADEVTWKSSDAKIATVTESGNTATVTGVKAGTATITATYGGETATCVVTVMQNPESDSETVLKDKDGNELYIKDSDGKYTKATYADYFTAKTFYKQLKAVKYKYTGWQTLEGKTYFFDKNGNPVTGEQIILGAKYTFDSQGALVSGSGTMGIDVSKWNGNINWNAVKSSGVSYVIIRCGYRGSSTGALIEDPMFKKNIQGASAAGLKIGIYFFTQAVTEVEAVEEASMTINLIEKYGIAYPVFIDVEGSRGRADGLSKDARTSIVNAYCKTIQNAGYKAGIYANKTWLESKLNMSTLNQYKVWLAQYSSQYTYKGKVDLWQYSDRGTISGISGKVDMNISYLGY